MSLIERPQADHVICGPMIGLENNYMARGHINIYTSRLLDRIGPVG